MKVTLISLPLLGLKGDPFGSIPSMPVGITYLAAYLKSKKNEVSIIDSFGSAPHQKRISKEYAIYGLNAKETAERIPANTELIGISVHSGAQHELCRELIHEIRKTRKTPIAVGGAQPSVTHKEFLDMGADYVVIGEGEESTQELIQHLKGKKRIETIDGIAYKKKSKTAINEKKRFIKNLDKLPFPAIDLLPLEKYWKLGYAHGPVKGKYLFLITSRGCPYNCNFCATPKLWQRLWRARSAKNIADEMEQNIKRYNVRDFHIQDDNLTLKEERVIEFCNELIKRRIKANWKLAAGMKIETIKEETLKLMKKAGCDYISFSPESGSKRALELMNKPFNHKYALKMAKKMNKLGIKTQACFVLGYPGEKKEDIKKTEEYATKLTKAGVDEIALFIMTPLPGAKAYKQKTAEYEALNFSPKWRKDYKQLSRARKNIYIKFILTKMAYHPLKLAKQLKNALQGKFETKMEMALYRILFGRV